MWLCKHRYYSIFKRKADYFSQNLIECEYQKELNIVLIMQKESLHEKEDEIAFGSSQDSELYSQKQMTRRGTSALIEEKHYCPIIE